MSVSVMEYGVRILVECLVLDTWSSNDGARHVATSEHAVHSSGQYLESAILGQLDVGEEDGEAE